MQGVNCMQAPPLCHLCHRSNHHLLYTVQCTDVACQGLLTRSVPMFQGNPASVHALTSNLKQKECVLSGRHDISCCRRPSCPQPALPRAMQFHLKMEITSISTGLVVQTAKSLTQLKLR